MDSSVDKLFLTLVAGSVLKNTAAYLLSLRHRRLTTRTKVGTLVQVTVYPVKSFKGVSVKEAKCETFGLVTDDGFRDRSLMVCNEDYKMVTGRQQPKLVLIRPTLSNQVVTLEADGMEPLTIDLSSPAFIQNSSTVQTSVWGQDIEAVDCGKAASDWLCRYVGKSGLKLVYHTTEMKRRQCSDGDTHWHKFSRPSDQVSFQDGFPFMLMSEASMAQLNVWLPDDKVAHVAQFRPNFVVRGSEAFDEDRWHELHIGGAVFTNIKPCSRCIFTTVSPVEGKKDEHKEPLMTLRRHRMTEPELAPSPCLGINLILEQPGRVRVGDDVWATFKY